MTSGGLCGGMLNGFSTHRTQEAAALTYPPTSPGSVGSPAVPRA